MKHFKQLLIGIILFLCTFFSYAQIYDTTQYFGKINYIFQNVNKSIISTGYLKDYGIEFLNLDNYKGSILHDSNFVSIDEWRLLYSSLYSSQVNGNANMLYLDTINRLINKYNYTSMPVTFAGLYYNYQRFRDDAVSANLMSISNDRLYDVAGRTQSPYQNEELFAVAPIRQALFTGSNNIIFRPELFKTNTGKTISSIAIDTTNGSSYVIVPLNTPYNLTYNTKGFYNLNIKVVYTDGTIRYGHTKLVVYDSPQNTAARYGTAFTPATNEPVTATRAYLGALGQGDITIDLARNNTTGQIRKPLIVVEGFDPDGGFTYSNRGGYLDFLNSDINTGTDITLNNGLDDINTYDLIFLNFTNGTDYIQRNAFLLERVIQIVNGRKTTFNGVRQQNVIIGMSMGGLVLRYALRDMELINVAHETRLFISHDAPQWGANIPVGAQAAVQHLAPFQIANIGGSFPFIRWVDMFPLIVDALGLYNSPAAKQIMIQRYDLGGANGQTLTANNTAHDNFLNEINTMGWPINCRNLTLSNGACNGTLNFPDNSRIFSMSGDRSMSYFGALWRSLGISLLAPATAVGLVNGWGSPQFNSWAMVWQFPLSLFSTKSSIGIDFFAEAVPKTGTKEIYRGDIYSKKKILFVINVTNYFVKCHAQSTTGMLPLDNAPGGVYDLESFGFNPTIIQNSLPSFFTGYVQTTVLQPRFCFVPTVSSLAFTNPASKLFSNICATVSCENPALVRDYFAPNQNQIHISYTQPNSDWILQRQDNTFNCFKICSATSLVTGDNIVCSTSNPYIISNLPVGASPVWSSTPLTIATVNTPNALQTTITRNLNGIITLNASVANVCGNNPIITLSKPNIVIGIPTITSSPPLAIWQGNSTTDYNNVCNLQTFYTNMQAPGATSVSWSKTTSNPSNLSWSQSGNNINFYFWSVGQTSTFKINASNACGTLSQSFGFKSIDCGGGGGSCNRYSISPNPANGNLKIIVPNIPPPCKVNIANEENESGETLTIKQIRIFDNAGNLKKTQKENKSKQANINISGLISGVYNIEISDGTYKERQQVVIKQ